MARWRSEALKRLPELNQLITKCDTVMMFWIELGIGPFRKAYESDPRDDSLITRIYSFADWCARAPRNADAGRDPATAVAVAFYEHIPTFPPARDDMPRWFHLEEITKGEKLFGRHLDAPQFLELVHFMTDNAARYVPRPLQKQGQ